MRHQTGLIIALCLLFLAGSGWTAAYHYSGSIGNRTAVQMDLTRQGSNLTGNYWYDAAGPALELTGSLRDGTATVKEYETDDVRRLTGAFTGTLSQNDRQFRGTWKSPDGKRSLPFAFTATAEYRTLTVKRKYFDLKGSYPVFFAAGRGWQVLSAQLRARVQAAQQGFLKDMAGETPHTSHNFEQIYEIGVAYADNALASLLILNFTEFGGAHPDTVYTSANYQVTADGPRLLGLNDLFTPGSGYQDALFKLVVADLNRQKTARQDIPLFGTFSMADLKVYTLSPRSITFVFSPAVAGAYVAGTYYVTIPYSQLAQYINPHGPLARFSTR